IFIIVDLPEPLGPIIEVNSPSSTVSDTLSSAVTTSSPIWYVLVTSFIVIIIFSPYDSEDVSSDSGATLSPSDSFSSGERMTSSPSDKSPSSTSITKFDWIPVLIVTCLATSSSTTKTYASLSSSKFRSEERRVGKECKTRFTEEH